MRELNGFDIGWLPDPKCLEAEEVEAELVSVQTFFLAPASLNLPQLRTRSGPTTKSRTPYEYQ